MLSRVRMSFVLPRRAAAASAAAAASRVPAGAVRSAVAASASAAAAQRRSLATGPQPKVMDYRDLAEPTERPPPYTGKEEYEEAREQARRAQDDGEYRGYNGSAGHMFHELLFSRSAIRSIAAAFVSAASVFLMGSYVLPENQRNVAEAQARDSDGNGHHAVRGGRASDLSGDVVPNSLEVIPSLGNPVPKVGDVVRYSIALEEEQKDGSVRSRPLRTFRRVVGNEEATLSGAALEAAKSLAGLPSGSQVSLRLKKDGKERKLVVVSSLERNDAATPEEAAAQKKSRGLKAKTAEARKNKQTPESRAALRKHLENLTPEQKKKIAEKYKALGDKKKKVKVLDRKALKRALEERKKKQQEKKQQQQQ